MTATRTAPDQATLHFVECRFGKATVFVERDTADMDLETTIRDIMSGEIENPVRVLAVFAEESFARDVSEDVAREIAARVQNDPISHNLIGFIARAAGDALALEMRAA